VAKGKLVEGYRWELKKLWGRRKRGDRKSTGPESRIFTEAFQSVSEERATWKESFDEKGGKRGDGKWSY